MKKQYLLTILVEDYEEDEYTSSVEALLDNFVEGDGVTINTRAIEKQYDCTFVELKLIDD